jgi:hypothetical protein
MRVQGVREYWKEFAITVEQLAYRACSALPDDNIRWEAGKAFADMVEDPSSSRSTRNPLTILQA